MRGLLIHLLFYTCLRVLSLPLANYCTNGREAVILRLTEYLSQHGHGLQISLNRLQEHIDTRDSEVIEEMFHLSARYLDDAQRLLLQIDPFDQDQNMMEICSTLSQIYEVLYRNHQVYEDRFFLSHHHSLLETGESSVTSWRQVSQLKRDH